MCSSLGPKGEYANDMTQYMRIRKNPKLTKGGINGTKKRVQKHITGPKNFQIYIYRINLMTIICTVLKTNMYDMKEEHNYTNLQV